MSIKFIRSTFWLIVASLTVGISVPIAKAQTGSQALSNAAQQEQVAKATGDRSATKDTPANVPLLKDYRGVRIGMSVEEVRAKLDKLKEGDHQDILVFSEKESAQIFYDGENKVKAISVDYFSLRDAPSPESILGTSVQPRPDGSAYQLKRYPDAGYWVSYNRTAGDKPLISITMQRL